MQENNRHHRRKGRAKTVESQGQRNRIRSRKKSLPMVASVNAIRIRHRVKKDRVTGKERKGADNNHSKRAKGRLVRTHLQMQEKGPAPNRDRGTAGLHREMVRKANNPQDKRESNRAQEALRGQLILVRKVRGSVATLLRPLPSKWRGGHNHPRVVEGRALRRSQRMSMD